MLAALDGDNTLTMIDTATMKAGKSMKVTGITGKIAGIDVRPADGMLYALAADGTIYTVDAAGKATMKSKMDTVLAANADGDRRLQPGRRPAARDGLRRHQPARQCR